jgi:hypothetical protein
MPVARHDDTHRREHRRQRNILKHQPATAMFDVPPIRHLHYAPSSCNEGHYEGNESQWNQIIRSG